MKVGRLCWGLGTGRVSLIALGETIRILPVISCSSTSHPLQPLPIAGKPPICIIKTLCPICGPTWSQRQKHWERPVLDLELPVRPRVDPSFIGSAHLEKTCPGLAGGISSIHSSIRTSVRLSCNQKTFTHLSPHSVPGL